MKLYNACTSRAHFVLFGIEQETKASDAYGDFGAKALPERQYSRSSPELLQSNYLKIETVCEKVFALTCKNAIMKQNSCIFKFFRIAP